MSLARATEESRKPYFHSVSTVKCFRNTTTTAAFGMSRTLKTSTAFGVPTRDVLAVTLGAVDLVNNLRGHNVSPASGPMSQQITNTHN